MKKCPFCARILENSDAFCPVQNQFMLHYILRILIIISLIMTITEVFISLRRLVSTKKIGKKSQG